MINFLRKNKLALTLVSILATVSLGAAGYIKYTHPKSDLKIDPVSGNTKGDSVTNEPRSGDSTVEPSGKINTPLSAPTLQKSSGNNGPVPSGVLMEFTCQGQVGISCEIILTNQGNRNEVIRLGIKKVADNGRGQHFARWEWESKQGGWSIVARVSEGTSTKDSTAHTLEVK